MQNASLSKLLNESKQTKAYENYIFVRNWVLKILEEEKNDLPSDYWAEELNGFDYMLDASPLIINKMREHCYHLTGLKSYEYRKHHAHESKALKKKLEDLRRLDKNNLLVSESPMLGGFGHIFDGQLFNIDTLKFYECFIALQQSNVLTKFQNSKEHEKKVVLEIGAGWGGFAYQFKTLFPNTCYIIVDLPQTLLFSAVYLQTLFPKSSFLFTDSKNISVVLNDYTKNDFIFIPHYLLKDISFRQIDLAVNIASFQEMKTDQVRAYIDYLARVKCSSLYSLNRDRSPHNNQLTFVSKIMEEFYNIKEQVVLDVSYIDFSPYLDNKSAKLNYLIKTIAKSLGVKKGEYKNYRHLIGNLR